MKDAPLVKLRRAQIGKARGVDTTVKSARGWARSFAPTWEMVMAWKRNEMTPEEYEYLYDDMLAAVPKEVWRTLYDTGRANGGEVVLLCYCRDEWFCHTYLLIDYACRVWPKAFCR